MQDYISLRIDVKPADETITDLLAAFLCDIGYESFSPDESGLTAYIRDDLFDKESVKTIIEEFPIPCEMKFHFETIVGKDWNEEWEKHYFQPIVIGDICVVHSTFHTEVPEAAIDIVIDPKMAFGTGHHSTTSLMMRRILDSEIKGKTVIDMGTGTGILAILARKLGASRVTGIEIDPFAWENAVDNIKLNNTEIEMICGDASKLTHLSPSDYLLANINRNIIVEDLSKYSERLNPGGIMYLSGFYDSDIPVIAEESEKHGLRYIDKIIDNGWAAIKLVKMD